PAIATAHGAPFQDAPLAAGRGFDLAALWALFVLTLRQHLRGRRLLVLSLLFLMPSVLALLFQLASHPPNAGDLELGLVFNLIPLAQVGYCAFFGTLSLLTRRSVLGGLAYILAVEGMLASFQSVLRLLTVIYYFRVLVVRWLAPAEARRAWSLDLETAPTASE